MTKILALLVTLGSSTISVAQDIPRLGLLYNTQERSSLTYSCEPVGAGRLNCEFVQTAVRQKASIGQLPEVLDRARKQFRLEKTPTPEQCELAKNILAVLAGKKTAPDPKAAAALTAVEKGDAQRSTQAFLDYCRKPNEDNYVALARVAHEKDRRTCTVSSNSFKQSFRAVSEGSSAGNWVTQSLPEGPCGVVQLSRFELEEVKIGETAFSNWRHIARKAITNPSGELFPGASCSRLDEQAYTYDWRTKEHQMTCDYIHFSPL